MRSTTATGAIAELIVCADVLTRGWRVFRAVDPQSKYDLVGETPHGRFVRIEVRTVGEREDGTLWVAMSARDRCDLYAFVCGHRIEYMTPRQALARRRRPDRIRLDFADVLAATRNDVLEGVWDVLYDPETAADAPADPEPVPAGAEA